MVPMSKHEYFRCHHVDPSGHQCNEWTPDEETKLCSRHSGLLGSNGDYSDILKQSIVRPVPYSELDETISQVCATLSIVEINEHIALLERKIEEFRAATLILKRNSRKKIDSLSEEEKQVLIEEQRATFPVNKVKEPKPKLDPILEMAQEMVKNYQKKGKEITLERAVQLAKQALEDE
jgi:uncharacterized small protein (DUF1192 family)